MYSEFFVENFRAIGPKSLGLRLAPLTVIVGPSGAGKSSFLEAMALTAQSAIEDPSFHDLVLDGSIIDIPTGFTKHHEVGKEIYNSKDTSRRLRAGFECTVDGKKWKQAGFGKAPPAILRKARDWPPKKIGYYWGRKGGDESFISSWSHCFFVDGSPCYELSADFIKHTESGGRYKGFLKPGPLSGFDGIELEFNQNYERVLPIGMVADDLIKSIPKPPNGFDDTYEKSAPFLRFLRSELLARLKATTFLSGLRGRHLLQSEAGAEPLGIGQHGELAKRLLVSQRARRHPAYKKLEQWAARFNLEDVDSSLAQSNAVSVSFQDPATKTILEIESGAAGSLQGLLVATMLLISDPGTCSLIEEPEIHMHPRFEAELVRLFADAVELGQQIVVTTHSEILVAAVANAIRNKLLKTDQVAVWHLDRNEEGQVYGEQVEISKKGNLKGWIKSFREIEERLFDEWTEALPDAE